MPPTRPTDDPDPTTTPAAAPAGRPHADSSMASWHRMTGVGIEFIVAVALMGGIGYGLDRWLDTSPWLMIVGGVIGFAVGLYNMARAAKKSFRNSGNG